MNIQDAWLKRFKEIVQSEIDAAGGRAADGYRAVETKTGLGYDYIYQIFKGKPAHKPKSPSIDVMAMLERKYGQADANTVSMIFKDADEKELLTIYRQIPPENRPKVISMAKLFLSTQEVQNKKRAA